MGQALKKTELTNLILNENEIENGNLPIENIFEIKMDGEIIGPFLGKELKDFLEDSDYNLSEIEIKNVTQNEWTEFVTHPYFQRRRPQLVENVNDSAMTYYLLIEGQKQGPFTEDKINELLSEKAILHIDEISTDEGQSWNKIYHFNQFDRRKLTNKSLPNVHQIGAPLASVADQSKILQLAREKSEKEDALVGLAFTHHPNDTKATSNGPVIIEEDHSSEETSAQTTKWPWAVLLVASLAGIAILLFKGTSNTAPSNKVTIEKGFKAPKAKLEGTRIPASRSKEPTPIRAERVDNKVRRPPTVTRGIKPFKDSDTFKNYKKRQMEDDAMASDESYYSEGEDDEMRGQIPRDTMDPVIEAEELIDAEPIDARTPSVNEDELFDKEQEF